MIHRGAIVAGAAAIFLAATASAQPAAAPAPAPPLPYGTPLNAAQAQAAMTAAEGEARRNGWTVTIAVIEPNGQLMAFRRLDGASYGSIDAAMGKARTAAFFRQPSSASGERLAAGNLSPLAVPNMLPVQGGVPIVAGGRIIGAIGVSGATAQQDEDLATLGAKAASAVN